MIGIEIDTQNSKQFFKEILKKISINQYDIYISDVEIFKEENNMQLSEKISNAEYNNLINDEYIINFLKMEIFKKNNKRSRLGNYTEFSKSSCEAIVLIIDEKYIEIYFKDNELRTSIMTIIDTLELSYKIKNTYNDTRTSMEIC